MKKGIEICTDHTKLDIELIFDFLSNRSYWAKGRNREIVQSSIDNSFCFGVYLNDEQIGFARVVTDYSLFAWLMDVFILENHRGKGYGKVLMNAIMNHDKLKTIKRWGLNTDDAHELYKQLGFRELEKPEIMMELVRK